MPGARGRTLRLALQRRRQRRALVHGHCHQKAFGAMERDDRLPRLVPGLQVETIESSCCGMAGAFGYEAEHHAISLRMAELRCCRRCAPPRPTALIVADGTSCRHQIHDGAGREAVHVARVLADALAVRLPAARQVASANGVGRDGVGRSPNQAHSS